MIHAYDVVDGGTRLANRRTLIDRRGRRHARRLPLRRRRQPVVRLGHGRARASTASSIFNPDGKLIGRIDLPERCANLCFGGLYRNRLFMAASTSVYSLYVNTQGARGG